tara:strand:+ start:189 stop:452 length:264 start_codon:yes stop_codon:yes gene_type:complete
MENTQENRIALIREAYLNSKAIAPKQSVENFVEEVLTEDVIVEHGLFEVHETDVEDENQYLNSDSAEDIDEEDQEIGLSDEMKGVYK